VDVNIKQPNSAPSWSWETFNVGQHTILNFDPILQRASGTRCGGTEIASFGDSMSPAEILGQIRAQGTVLIIDTNGILFGGASQINVNSLIASALEIGHPVDPITQALLTAKNATICFWSMALLGTRDQASSQEQQEKFTFSPSPTRTTLASSRIASQQQSGSHRRPGRRDHHRWQRRAHFS